MTVKDPFHEPHASDQPGFDIHATDPMRLRKEMLNDMGIDQEYKNPVAGGVRLVFDPVNGEKTPVKIDSSSADEFYGQAENGTMIRAIWAPGENKWVKAE